jgi:hypothetical protein
VFVPGKPLQLIVMQHSSLFSPFISFEEKEVLWLVPLWLYSQHFVFFITYEWTKYVRVFVPGKPFQPSGPKHSSLLGAFVSSEENEALWIPFQILIFCFESLDPIHLKKGALFLKNNIWSSTNTGLPERDY